ncbi:MAG: CsgG/HfaB family protein [Gemmatimonadales bacterium]
MRSRSLFATLAAAALLLPASLVAQDGRPGIAVMTFENGGSYGQDSENFDALQIGLQQMLITEFSQNEGLRVVDRSRLRDLMEEQDLGGTGRVDANTAARVGQLVGARFMVFGSFVDFYGDMRLDVRIVDTETSEIVRTENVRDRREQLYSMVTSLASQITSNLNLPELPASVRQAREARDVPAEAIQYYSRALMYADRGDNDRAVRLFNRAIDVFPEYTEAQEGLRQIEQG